MRSLYFLGLLIFMFTESPGNGESSLNRRQLFVFGCLCGIWGTTWLAIRVVVQQVPPLRAAAIRFSSAAILLGIMVFGRRPWPNREQFRSLLVLAATMIALPYGLLFWAEQYVNSSMTAVLYATTPLITALLTPLMSSHRVPRRAVFCMLLGFGGIAEIFYTELSATKHLLWGGCASLLSVSSSAWSSLYAKRNLGTVNPMTTTAVQLGAGALLLFAASLALERGLTTHWSFAAIAGIAYLSIFGSVIAFSLYYWLLKHVMAYQLSGLNLITPILAIAVGSLLLREPLPFQEVLAAALVLASVAVVLIAPQELAVATLSLESESTVDGE